MVIYNHSSIINNKIKSDIVFFSNNLINYSGFYLSTISAFRVEMRSIQFLVASVWVIFLSRLNNDTRVLVDIGRPISHITKYRFCWRFTNVSQGERIKQSVG